MDFGRMVTAMATPFDGDHIDEAGLCRLIDHLLETGTTGLVVNGTTGESPTLTHDEKLQLFALTVQHVAGRVPVMAGTGSNDTLSSIALSQEAAEIGVQGLLLVAPYYNKPTQDGLYAHFAAIAQAVPLPIMLYNIPGRSAINIDVETVLRLAQEPNVFAVKEASSQFSHIAALAARKPDDLLLYSGNDADILPILSLGGYGVVSVASHVVGPELSAMMDAFIAGDVRAAATWNGRLLPIIETLFKVSSPAPLKAALRLMGLPAGSVRLPLVDAPASIVEELAFELTRLAKL